MSGKKGYTLLELIVTIGIIAIVSSIGIPAFTNWVPLYKLKKDVVNLKVDLEKAKLIAKREGICIDVIFIDNGYTIFKNNGTGLHSCNTTLDDDETIIGYQKLSPGVTFGDVAFGVSKNARFKRNGEAKQGHIVLNGYDGVGSKKIIVSYLGRIRIE